MVIFKFHYALDVIHASQLAEANNVNILKTDYKECSISILHDDEVAKFSTLCIDNNLRYTKEVK